jgi:hypothetical protein
MKHRVIKLDIDFNFTGVESVYVKADAWESGEITLDNLVSYGGKAELLSSKVLRKKYDDKQFVRCEETGVDVPKEFARGAELYNTPWETSCETTWFSSDFAADCYRGIIYSKDFAYFDCPECGRTICEQNPRNGWMVQYRWLGDCEQICTSCVEKQMFEIGDDEMIGGALFMDDGELREHGFMPDREYYINTSANEEAYRTRLNELRKTHHVITCIDSMAIGGLEGFVTIYIKERENGNDATA